MIAKKTTRTPKKKNWIQNAIKNPSSFTKQAKRAGKSVSEFTKDVLKKGSDFAKTTKKRANLAKTLKKLNKKKEILALYKKGELELKPATVEKLERDIKTLEDKIDGLIGRNESQRTVVKEKEINLK